MKTLHPATVRVALVGAVALGAFSIAAFAGPGPQYWNKAPAAKAPVTAPAKCDGCKTTIKWGTGDRGPAGKGVPGTSVVGKTHECNACAGAVVAEKGKTKDSMSHAAACASLLCCK